MFNNALFALVTISVCGSAPLFSHEMCAQRTCSILINTYGLVMILFCLNYIILNSWHCANTTLPHYDMARNNGTNTSSISFRMVSFRWRCCLHLYTHAILSLSLKINAALIGMSCQKFLIKIYSVSKIKQRVVGQT